MHDQQVVADLEGREDKLFTISEFEPCPGYLRQVQGINLLYGSHSAR